MSPIVVGELEGGFRSGIREERNLADLSSFLAHSSVEVLPLTRRTASFYGRLAAALRRRGRPIPTNDVWIAAQALEAGADLISYDAHFGEIEGLALVRPSA
jgi:tRNA(fMet)-specific endonuclease VapC